MLLMAYGESFFLGGFSYLPTGHLKHLPVALPRSHAVPPTRIAKITTLMQTSRQMGPSSGE